MTNNRILATAIGCIAIFLWGVLALLSKLAGDFPPFQLLAMCFSIAFIFMLIKWAIYKQSILVLAAQPLSAWLIGCLGLFLYHACYFFALANAPVLEVSLIAYLWPLLIVLFSAFLPGEKLLFKHVLGAMISLMGCWILLGGAGSNFNSSYLTGYLLAAACAILWATYTVLSRLVKQVPTDTVGLFCGVCALLGWLCHFYLEQSYFPENTQQWLAVLSLGLGPLGLAFFAWDYGVKQGNIQLLGVLSYATPLISTAMLITFTDILPSSTLYIACSAIILGALIASIKLPTKYKWPAKKQRAL
ncbi:MAG: EamA family transporter [Oceanospirillaceae bacterium]